MRLIGTFLRSEGGGADGVPRGHRPIYHGSAKFQTDPYWRDLILFYEYLHGDTGAGVGASHQTGWTGAVAFMIPMMGDLAGGRYLQVISQGAIKAEQAEQAEKAAPPRSSGS
jgi:hypothetical protein